MTQTKCDAFVQELTGVLNHLNNPHPNGYTVQDIDTYRKVYDYIRDNVDDDIDSQWGNCVYHGSELLTEYSYCLDDGVAETIEPKCWYYTIVHNPYPELLDRVALAQIVQALIEKLPDYVNGVADDGEENPSYTG